MKEPSLLGIFVASKIQCHAPAEEVALSVSRQLRHILMFWSTHQSGRKLKPVIAVLISSKCKNAWTCTPLGLVMVRTNCRIRRFLNQGGHIERSKRFSLGIRTVMMLRPLFCPEGSYEADSETSSNKKYVQRNVEALEFSCWSCHAIPLDLTTKSYHIYHNIPGTFCSGCHPWLLVALMTPSMGHLRASQP